MSKFLSRKFLLAVAAFVAVNVTPNLSSGAQVRWSSAVAIAYAVAEGAADVISRLKSSS